MVLEQVPVAIIAGGSFGAWIKAGGSRTAPTGLVKDRGGANRPYGSLCLVKYRGFANRPLRESFGVWVKTGRFTNRFGIGFTWQSGLRPFRHLSQQRVDNSGILHYPRFLQHGWMAAATFIGGTACRGVKVPVLREPLELGGIPGSQQMDCPADLALGGHGFRVSQVAAQLAEGDLA